MDIVEETGWNGLIKRKLSDLGGWPQRHPRGWRIRRRKIPFVYIETSRGHKNPLFTINASAFCKGIVAWSVSA